MLKLLLKIQIIMLKKKLKNNNIYAKENARKRDKNEKIYKTYQW